MKKNYFSPVLEVKALQTETVLALSAMNDPDGNPINAVPGADHDNPSNQNPDNVLSREEVEQEWD